MIFWCRREESNLRPTDYESVALPTELLRQGVSKYNGFPRQAQAPAGGLSKQMYQK